MAISFGESFPGDQLERCSVQHNWPLGESTEIESSETLPTHSRLSEDSKNAHGDRTGAQ